MILIATLIQRRLYDEYHCKRGADIFHGIGAENSWKVADVHLTQTALNVGLKLFRDRNIIEEINCAIYRGTSMDFLTSSEMGKKWGISSRRVTLLCNEGRIDGALKKGFIWLIPEEAEKPADPRRTSNGTKK